MRNLWIIVKEVYLKNVKSWSFVFMVLGPILIMAVIALIGFFIAQDEAQSRVGEIAVVNAPAEVVEAIEASPDNNSIIYEYSSEEARTALENDEIEGFMVFGESTETVAPKYYRKPTSKDINLTTIQQTLSAYQVSQLASEIGLSSNQLAQIQNSSVAIETINLTTDDEGNVSEASSSDPMNFAKIAIAYVVSFLVFFFVMTYVGIISQEIAAEKGSRIMEILLSSVSASTHFFGKMIGIGFVILTQLASYLLIFLIARLFVSNLEIFNFLEEFNLSAIFAESQTVIWISILFGIIGILIYSALGGFLGSLVSKTEDVNKVITPIIFIALAGFYIGMYALNSTNNPIVRIGSHIPFFTPFVMPFRIAAETVGSTELIIAIVISVVFMAFCLWFSVVFYKSNVLVYTDKGVVNALKNSWTLWQSERKS